MKTIAVVTVVAAIGWTTVNAQETTSFTGLLKRAESSQFTERKEALQALINVMETQSENVRAGEVLKLFLKARHTAARHGSEVPGEMATLEMQIIRSLGQMKQNENREFARTLVQLATNTPDEVPILQEEALRQMTALATAPKVLQCLVDVMMSTNTGILASAARTSLVSTGWLAVPNVIAYCAAHTSSDICAKGSDFLVETTGRDTAAAIVKVRLNSASDQREKDNLGTLLIAIEESAAKEKAK